jgi:hypothetical protein
MTELSRHRDTARTATIDAPTSDAAETAASTAR